MDIWAQLDRILETSPYIRFSLACHRNWDDVTVKTWYAVIFREKGQIIADAYGATRDEAVGAVIAEAAISGTKKEQP
jgi:hypothetical protein